MEKISTQLNVITIESDALVQLVEHILQKMNPHEERHKQKWIGDDMAMKILNIKSKTTLQSYRDKGLIRYSQIGRKVILYDRESIIDFIESQAKEIF